MPGTVCVGARALMPYGICSTPLCNVSNLITESQQMIDQQCPLQTAHHHLLADFS